MTLVLVEVSLIVCLIEVLRRGGFQVHAGTNPAVRPCALGIVSRVGLTRLLGRGGACMVGSRLVLPGYVCVRGAVCVRSALPIDYCVRSAICVRSAMPMPCVRLSSTFPAVSVYPWFLGRRSVAALLIFVMSSAMKSLNTSMAWRGVTILTGRSSFLRMPVSVCNSVEPVTLAWC